MTRPFILGLTGSMAMGKTTVAQMFAARGIPVFDSDHTVHDLYRAGHAGAAAVARLTPDVLDAKGAVDRARLSQWLGGDKQRLAQVEAAIHPLVAAERAQFLQKAQAQGADLVVFDIPLLFEVGAERACDRVLLVTAPLAVQHARALARPGMTAEKFAALRARQMGEEEKRARADFVIDTSQSLAETERAVAAIIQELRRPVGSGKE